MFSMQRPLNVDQLRPLYADDLGALGALFRETVGVTAQLIGQLERRERTTRDSLHTAHELKGICRTTGAEELAFLATEVEECARDGRWEDVDDRLVMLWRAHRRLVDAVAAIGFVTGIRSSRLA